jgi:hypothetical protein
MRSGAVMVHLEYQQYIPKSDMCLQALGPLVSVPHAVRIHIV